LPDAAGGDRRGGIPGTRCSRPARGNFFANEPAQRAILRVAGTLMFVAAALVLARV